MTEEERKEIAFRNFDSFGGFIKNNNFKLIDIKEGYCEMEATITESSMNPYDICHGGFLFGLLDTCCGVCASSDGRGCLTISSNINFMRAVTGTKVKVICNTVKNGKHISLVEGNIFDDQDRIVCNGSVSYYYIDNHDFK